MRPFFRHLRHTFRGSRAMALLGLFAALATVIAASRHATAQNIGPLQTAANTPAPTGRVILVLPFDNRSGNASLNWIGDSFPDTLDRRLNSAGFLTISQDDRVYSLEHLGLPADFRPSRATTIRIAQQLDANFVVIGSYTLQPGPAPAVGTATSAASLVSDRIAIQAQVLDIDNLRLSAPVQDGADLSRLFDAENAIAWKVARTVDPAFNVAETTFLGAPGSVPLPAFENYIRGTNAPTPAERLRRLQTAVSLVPSYPEALLALGKAQYAARDYAAAAATLSKFPQNDPLSLEANFYLGLARFNSNNYPAAEQAFAFVDGRLPLPEVTNDQGVAVARQGKDASTWFQRASAADPSNEDYHFNLAVALFRRGDTTGALREADAALKLKPNDQEAGELRARIASAPPGTRLPPAATATGAFNPVPRIIRTYSETGFRQAAFQLNQLRAARLSMLPPPQAAAEYNALGRDYLAQGLLPEAEQQFAAALAVAPNDPAAHAGLAEIRVASNNLPDARREAEASLAAQPTALGYVALAHVDLAQNLMPAAAEDVSRALRLEPNNSAALALKLSLQQRNITLP